MKRNPAVTLEFHLKFITTLQIAFRRRIAIHTAKTVARLTTQATNSKMEPLKAEIERQAAKVTQLKAAASSGKPELQSEIDKLVALKKQLAALELTSTSPSAPAAPKFDRGALEELLKKRFFYAPSFGIYGGSFVSTRVLFPNRHKCRRFWFV
jgi:glycyl-tRNA synthetase (class II)